MDTPGSKEITQLLAAWSGGDRDAFERLVPLVYAEPMLLIHNHQAELVEVNLVLDQRVSPNRQIRLAANPTSR